MLSNKQQLLQQLEQNVKASLALAIKAAAAARLDATHEQSKAETQYDSLGTEMSYLADGQNQRIIELKQELYEITQFSLPSNQSNSVQLGSLVCLEDDKDNRLYYFFILPFCGGLKVLNNNQQVNILSLQSPLSQLLIGKQLDDEIIARFKTTTHYWVTQID